MQIAVYEEIESIIKFFVGEQDNVTLSNLEYLKQAVQLNNAAQLLDSLKMVEFQDTLTKSVICVSDDSITNLV